jgi:ATP-dependent DNA helicase UvrD/PcrA
VMLCLNVLRGVAFPDEGAPIHFALGDPLFGADPVDLATLGSRARRFNRPLLEVAAQAASGNSVKPATAEAVSRFADLHRRLCASAVRRPTSEVLYEFVTESGLLGRLAADESPEAIEQVQNLNKLFRIVTRVGPLLREDRTPQFIHHLDLLIEMGDDPTAAEVEREEDAVSLLTAHNAKGLEFRIVYMVHLVEGMFPLQARGAEMELPAELRHETADDKDAHYREERRLFYVAATRAQDRLVLTHAADVGWRRSMKPSRFLVEMLALPSTPKTLASPSALESIARYAPAAESPAAEVVPIPDDQVLEISHSRIDDYVTCPLKYRYAHVAQVPLASDPQFMYGNAIHYAIRVYHQHRMRGHPIDADAVISAFDSAWSSEGFYSREHEELRQAEGRDALRRFVAREDVSKVVPLAIEREFKFKLARNNVVVGRWDRIDERDGGIVLVDYKTSEIEDASKAEQRARDSLMHDQLGLYALAYAEATGQPPARVELHFVGPGVSGVADVRRSHLEAARSRAEKAAAGIRSAQFPPNPTRRNCGFCPYSRFCVHSMARGS